MGAAKSGAGTWRQTLISILDYGVGNLSAFSTIYRRLHVEVEIASTAEQVLAADRLILPGVGSFDAAMEKLNGSGMRDALDVAILDRETPLLGVCVGMQMLGTSSVEGSERGLAYVSGHIESMESVVDKQSACLPHMGWNSIRPANAHPIWKSINMDLGFYFLHTYYFKPDDPASIFAETDYGNAFPSAVQKKNIFGVQFHPEKSHSNGVALLRNFSEL